MTRVINDIKDWLALRGQIGDRTIGFVPTMGALHDGHKSLIDRSKQDNDVTVVSIFVNPTQFNDEKDFKVYPRVLDKDLKLLNDSGVDCLLSPSYEAMYPDKYSYRVTENEFSKILEGEYRPGHFDGVLTVVLKLLNLVNATRAYFGEKDFQQYSLIRGMAEAFFIRTEIVMCPTVRYANGLAMSSRNALLSVEERKLAPEFARLLRSNGEDKGIVDKLTIAGFKVEYVHTVNGRRFGAVKLGAVRLIDNVLIN